MNMSRINRDKKIFFKTEHIHSSLLTFICHSIDRKRNPYSRESGLAIYASRNELENFLIDLLAKIIDDKMESWVDEFDFWSDEENPAEEESKS